MPNTGTTLNSIATVTLATPGSGYATAPTVAFNTPSGGLAATGYATLNTSGGIAAIVITNPGWGVQQQRDCHDNRRGSGTKRLQCGQRDWGDVHV